MAIYVHCCKLKRHMAAMAAHAAAEAKTQKGVGTLELRLLSARGGFHRVASLNYSCKAKLSNLVSFKAAHAAEKGDLYI
eukprot:10344-Heterococcus_DN1.PRE.4